MKHQSKAKFTTASQFRATLFNSWINLLFFIVPNGFAVRYTSGNSLATFLVNFFAIIPLPSAAEYAIAELTLYVGENWNKLVYITIRYERDSSPTIHRPRDVLMRLSNFVQIVSCIFLLRSNQLDTLQTNLIDRILSSKLLILGLSIFMVEVNRIEQHFNMTVAHLSANLLSLAATSLLIPTASHLLLQTSEEHILR